MPGIPAEGVDQAGFDRDAGDDVDHEFSLDAALSCRSIWMPKAAALPPVKRQNRPTLRVEQEIGQMQMAIEYGPVRVARIDQHGHGSVGVKGRTQDLEHVRVRTLHSSADGRAFMGLPVHAVVVTDRCLVAPGLVRIAGALHGNQGGCGLGPGGRRPMGQGRVGRVHQKAGSKKNKRQAQDEKQQFAQCGEHPVFRVEADVPDGARTRSISTSGPRP